MKERVILYIIAEIIIYFFVKTIIKIEDFNPGINELFQNKFFLLPGDFKNEKKIKQKLGRFTFYFMFKGEKMKMAENNKQKEELTDNQKEFFVIQEVMIKKFNRLLKNVGFKYLKIIDTQNELVKIMDLCEELDTILEKTRKQYKISCKVFSFQKQAEKVLYEYYKNMNCLMCKEKWCLHLGNVKKGDMVNFKSDLFHKVKYHPILDVYSFKCWNKHQTIRDLPIAPEYNVCPFCKKELSETILDSDSSPSLPYGKDLRPCGRTLKMSPPKNEIVYKGKGENQSEKDIIPNNESSESPYTSPLTLKDFFPKFPSKR